jgi:hypothetical protein
MSEVTSTFTPSFAFKRAGISIIIPQTIIAKMIPTAGWMNTGMGM